jgi:diacylglycerol kinase (ATP)
VTVVVVANPTAGRGKGAKLIPQVDALLRELAVDHTMVVCKDGADPERLARQAVDEGADIVAALGGDGQVGLVANGLVGADGALAVIPAGTGNDFAGYLGINAKEPLSAARLVANPNRKRIDVVRVTTTERERYFVNVAGAGFDSEVNEHANKVRRLKGTAKYIYSTFVTLARFKAGRFQVTVDGDSHDLPAMMIAVGNAVSYGGGMHITPGAKADDGELEIVAIGEVSKLDFVRTFPKVFKGRHIDHPKVTVLHGKEVEMSADRPFQVYADGEPVGRLPVSFSVVPGALDVVVP